MHVLIRYKEKYRFRRWLSGFVPVSVRVFAVDTLNGGKPVGCQRMNLNFVYDVGMHNVCLAGNLPKKNAENKYIDFKSVDWFNEHIEIVQVVQGKDTKVNETARIAIPGKK